LGHVVGVVERKNETVIATSQRRPREGGNPIPSHSSNHKKATLTVAQNDGVPAFAGMT
jgi:hypothetical protein